MNRCDSFLNALSERGFGAALLHRSANIRWLTGYTGEGCAFITDKAQTIVTDFRYVEQVGRQAPQCRCIQTGAELTEPDAVLNLCKEFGVQKILVETDFLTYDQYMALQAKLEGIEMVSIRQLPEQLRAFKDDFEISCIRKAAAISCQAFENLLKKIHAGMTEKQVQIMLDNEMMELGAEAVAFSTIAAAGVNGSLPHAIPSDYVIQEGDLLTLDFGARYGGYCSDITRTVGFGKVRPELREIYQRVYEAQLMALDAVRPGAVCCDIDKVARDHLDARYPGAFGHSLGHGVGLYIHEQPRVARASTTVLEPGHVITIEPGVYIPGVGGCRIEDTVILTSDGYINTMTAPKQLIEL